jgi:nucleotide-binding universal stress UspA family protein
MWKRILVPHDFSPCAARALEVAADLARAHGGKLFVVHVSELPANLPTDTLIFPQGEDGAGVRVDEHTTRAARRSLEELVEPLRRSGLEVRTFAMVGEIEGVVFGLASEIEADVLVVGTHGRKGLSHLFLGSVAEKLVRGATVPVVTVRTKAPEAKATTEERRAEDELEG